MTQLKIELGHICQFITPDFNFNIDVKRHTLHFTADTNDISFAVVYQYRLLKRTLVKFINAHTSIKDVFFELMLIYDAVQGDTEKFIFAVQKAVNNSTKKRERSYA